MRKVAPRIGAITVLLLISVALKADDGKYKKPFVPMMPGLPGLVKAVKDNLNKPNLKEAGGDSLFAADLGSESFMGASNYATTMSNGRLSAGISPWGELTFLRWPHVTHSDQLRYFTQDNGMFTVKAEPVRMVDPQDPDWKRYSRVIESIPDLASQGYVYLKGGDEKILFSSPGWSSFRTFDHDNVPILRTTLSRPGVSIEISDLIDPDQDVMIRNMAVTGEIKSFGYQAAFAPMMAKPADYAKSDPKDAGFAVGYLVRDQAMLAFKPRQEDQKKLKDLGDRVSDQDLDWAFPEGGVFIAYGFLQGAEGAYAYGQELSCPHIFYHSIKLNFQTPFVSSKCSFMSNIFSSTEGPENLFTLIIALGPNATETMAKFRAAKAEELEAFQERFLKHWQKISSQIHLPPTNDPVTTRVIRRSVLNLIQGQDRDTGAIVASLARQPHYHFDWPRDGAFFDLTLDLAGFPERVTHHHDFYKNTQLKQTVEWSGARLMNFRSPIYNISGNWPSNMATDGSYGSIPEALDHEIDETALTVWNFWRHERTLPECERPAYREKMRETLTLAADALVREVDFRQAWTKPAFEDDNIPPDATLHGAAAVLAGLAGACDAGPRFEVDADKVNQWCEAAKVLRGGIVGRIDDPEILEEAGWRGISWTLWPAPVFETYDEPGAVMLKQKLAEQIRHKMDKNKAGFAYLGEDLFILALADRNQGEYRDLIESGLHLLTHEVAFPGTDCFGEVTMWGDFAGDGTRVAQQRTAIPHIWSGVTVYLTALALYEPEVFDGQRPPAP